MGKVPLSALNSSMFLPALLPSWLCACLPHRRTLLPLQVVSWGEAQCSGDRVVAALHSLFCAFAEEEQQRRQAGPLTGTAARRGLVNPSALRHALSSLPGQQFRVGESNTCHVCVCAAVFGQSERQAGRLCTGQCPSHHHHPRRLLCPLPFPAGEMNDAGEVLLSIYERVMGVSSAAAAAVDATFGLSVSEQVQCSSCRKVTQQSSYTQYFYNTQVGGWDRPLLAFAGAFVAIPLCAWALQPTVLMNAHQGICLHHALCWPALLLCLPCTQAAALQLARGMYPHLESMGQLFKFLESQHLKTCDEVSVHGCCRSVYKRDWWRPDAPLSFIKLRRCAPPCSS